MAKSIFYIFSWFIPSIKSLTRIIKQCMFHLHVASNTALCTTTKDWEMRTEIIWTMIIQLLFWTYILKLRNRVRYCRNKDSQLRWARWPGVFYNSHVWLLGESPGFRAGRNKAWSWHSCEHQPTTTTKIRCWWKQTYWVLFYYISNVTTCLVNQRPIYIRYFYCTLMQKFTHDL